MKSGGQSIKSFLSLNCANSGEGSHKSFISEITCHEIGMVELTNGIGLEPRYFVTEVSVEHIEAGLRQRPCVADIHLQNRTNRENMQTF